MRILALLALLIAYGSLYPGNFSSPGEGALETFLGNWRLLTSVGDMLGNIALFFPLGMAGVLFFSSRSGAPTHVGWLLFFGLIYSFALQLAQVWLPSRSAALADVMWNMVGLVLGAAATYLVGLRFRDRPAFHPPTLVPLAIVALWLLAELLPLIPTLDWQKMKDALKPLFPSFDFYFPHAILHAAAVLVAGSALGTLARQPALWLGGLLILMLAGKLVIVNLAVDASLLAGILAGYATYLYLLHRGSTKIFHAAFWFLLAAWTIIAMTPLSFTSGGTFSGIPFATMLRGSMETAAQETARSLFIYTALIWLAAKMEMRISKAALGLALWSCVIELSQMVFLGRTADVTEPMLILMIGWVLSSMRGSISVTGREPEPAPLPHSEALQATNALPVDAGKNRKQAFMLITIGIVIFTIGGWVILRSPLTPYNVRELLYQGHPFRSLILLVILLYWACGLPVLFTQWMARGQLYLLSLPPLALLHGACAWIMLRSAVPDEAIHDIVGSPILDWPGDWELLGRFIALFGLWSTATTGGMLIAARPLILHFGSALSGWVVGAFVLVPLGYYIVVSEASTDNLVELIANNGSLVAFLLIGLAMAIASSAGTRIALATVFTLQSGQAAAAAIWTLASAILTYALLYFGTEQVIVKYDQVFSAMQFLLSRDRSNLASPGELILRFATVYCVLVAAIAMVQYPLWRLVAKSETHAHPRTVPHFQRSADSY